MSAAKMFLTREEAAQACGVSLDTIRRSINRGALRAKRTSKNAAGEPCGKYLISVAELQAWFDQLEDA